MIILISPAKTLDYASPLLTSKQTEPRFMNDSAALIRDLKKLSAPQVSSLMKLSDKLGELNHHRFQTWRKKPKAENNRQAILAFKGDVYQGLDVDSFNTRDINFAQKHLRILSGLYGLLRPLDAIQPYRLEMGTKFKTEKAKNLYEFWGEKLTDQLVNDVKAEKSNMVINLASNEYSKAVDLKNFPVPVVSPVFKEKKNGQLKIISFFAKQARGMMSAYIIKNRIQTREELLKFDDDGYRYNAALSSPEAPVFVR